jgi:hypothetical protein
MRFSAAKTARKMTMAQMPIMDGSLRTLSGL